MEITTATIIDSVLAGGLLGLLGQGIRMAIGLKKLSDLNAAKETSNTEKADSTRLLISLFIGFVAGALFLLVRDGQDRTLTRELIFSVIAAGYSGADFIEGLFKNHFSKINSQTSGNSNTSQGNNANPDSHKEDIVVDEDINPNTKG